MVLNSPYCLAIDLHYCLSYVLLYQFCELSILGLQNYVTIVQPIHVSFVLVEAM